MKKKSRPVKSRSLKSYFSKPHLIKIMIAISIIFVITLIVRSNNAPGELDGFAKCLEEGGAKFYGSSSCVFCIEQKEMFGRSARHLPYIECSMPGGRGINLLCRNAQIESYPTWIFADGSREIGKLSLNRLSEKTGCY